jgi:hypothetical protein
MHSSIARATSAAPIPDADASVSCSRSAIRKITNGKLRPMRRYANTDEITPPDIDAREMVTPRRHGLHGQMLHHLVKRRVWHVQCCNQKRQYFVATDAVSRKVTTPRQRKCEELTPPSTVASLEFYIVSTNAYTRSSNTAHYENCLDP